MRWEGYDEGGDTWETHSAFQGSEAKGILAKFIQRKKKHNLWPLLPGHVRQLQETANDIDRPDKNGNADGQLSWECVEILPVGGH